MVVLAADTSTTYNTVALCRDGHLIAESTADAGRRHSERLLETVDWVLGEGGLRLADVELLAISTGPGSFTGLRIGVAAWKGLALALGLPLVAVPTLDALVLLAVRETGTVCTLLDAKMGEVFGAVYEYADFQRSKIHGDVVAPVEAMLEYVGDSPVFIGDGARVFRERILVRIPSARFLSPAADMPRAWTVAQEGLDRFRAGLGGNAAEVCPVYLRGSQPEEARARAAREAALR